MAASALDELSRKQDLADYLQRVRGEPPDHLLHFTSTDGLLGILEQRRLRLNRAFCMNDATEIRHVVVSVRAAVDGLLSTAGDSPHRHSFLSALRTLLQEDLDGWNEGASVEFLAAHDLSFADPYVASFCADSHDAQLLHWSHYGRAGEGFAVRIDTRRVASEWRARFMRVRYDQYREPVHTIVRQFMNDHDATRADPRAAARALMKVIRGIALSMKDPAFKDENEWRVTWLDDTDAHAGNFSPKQMRAKGAELISFVEMPLELEAVTDIIIGTKRDMRRTVGSLAAYLHGCGAGHINFEQSPVPFR